MVVQARTTKSGTVTPMTLQTQEIRLATTMTGGVSLAIWMGGVAREIDLLTQASNLRRLSNAASVTLEFSDELRVYSDLINLLDVSVDVDVLSGTSAGGINAALLAYARASKRSLATVRKLWLGIGSLVSLLRNPTDPDVPSLLQGDGVMLQSLQTAIPELAPVNHPAGGKLSTTLFITTTLLSGETSRFSDSYGTLVQDVDHRGMFRFTENSLSDTNALALAARSTASFPAAFEPSFLPCTPADAGKLPIGGVLGRACVGAHSNITRSHWAADGGLLDNQPIGAVLQKVFERPAKRLVRRVLLYVVPSAGNAPDPLAVQAGDDPAHAFGLLDGLMADIGAVKNQSIAADLRAIREHNDRIGARTDMRLRLAQLATRSAPSDQPALLAGGLFEDYRQREGESLGLSIVTEVMRMLTTWPVPKEVPWGNELTSGSRLEDDCKQAVVEALQQRWAAPLSLDSLAALDETSFYGAKAIVLSLLRCAFTIAQYDDSESTRSWQANLLNQVEQVHQAYQPNDGEQDVDRVVFEAMQDPNGVRSGPMPAAVASMALTYLDQGDRPRLAAGWQALGTVVGQVLAELTLPSSPPAPTAQPGSSAGMVRAAMENVQVYENYFASAETDLARAIRLFALHAAHRAMLPVDAEVDQPVELIQVSADTRTLLDLAHGTAQSKLTGMQLHHFGAFYKQSWRANDWMWGRLDGAGWLIHLLLDPRRINTVAEKGVDGSRITGFIEQLQRINVPLPEPGDQAASMPLRGDPSMPMIRAELAYLDNPNAIVPPSLPLLAMWVATVAQRQLLADELPTLAHTILHPDPSTGVAEQSSADAELWAKKVAAIADPATIPAQAGALLASCPVPHETFKTELGTPLMVHTVSKTAAVVTAAVHSVRQIPATVRPATSSMRTVALTGYRVTTAVKSLPRRVILAGLLLLVVGGVMATQQSTFLGLTGLLVAATGGYLVVFGAWQSSRLLLNAVVASTLVGSVASLCVAPVRRGLFGQPGTKSGWLGDRVVWLGEAWWHPLAGLGGVLVGFALLGLVFARIGEQQRPLSSRLSPRVNLVLAVILSLAVVALLAIALAAKG